MSARGDKIVEEKDKLKLVFSNNLKRELKIHNKNQTDLCEFLNLNSSTVSDWVNGKKYPRMDKVQKIADYLNIMKSDLTEEKQPFNKISRGVKIPVLGRVIAGIPVEAIEEIIDYEEIDEKTARCGNYFALQVKGDSMEPKMSEGDVVIVRQQDMVESGDVAIVLINGDEATVKRVRILDDGIMMIPFNTKYVPWTYTAKECEDKPVSIIGKVVECRQKY